KPAARNVTPDAGERLDSLLDRHAGDDGDVLVRWNLTERDAGNVLGRLTDRASDVGGHARRRVAHLVRGHGQWRLRPVEAASKSLEGRIALVAHPIHDGGD